MGIVGSIYPRNNISISTESGFTNTMKTQFIFFLLLLFFVGSALASGAEGGQKELKERNELNQVNEKLTEDISREALEEERGMKKKRKKKRCKTFQDKFFNVMFFAYLDLLGIYSFVNMPIHKTV